MYHSDLTQKIQVFWFAVLFQEDRQTELTTLIADDRYTKVYV